MIYQGKLIVFCDLPYGSGLALFKRLIFVRPTYYKGTKTIALDYTCRTIQHELRHTKQMLIALTFWIVILYQYAKYGYKNSPYEIEAREATYNLDTDLRIKLIEHFSSKNLKFQ